jgi:uncharacterized protein (DUF2141 family)
MDIFIFLAIFFRLEKIAYQDILKFMNRIVLLLFQSFIISFIPGGTMDSNYQDNNKNGIELTISNVRNKAGLIRIGVFSSDNGYPDKPKYSFSLAKDTMVSDKLTLFIPLKKSGLFSISILDDENENGKMDYFLGIIPKEGFGFSNNPKVTSRKAPSFEKTVFEFEKGKIQISVRMVYI